MRHRLFFLSMALLFGALSAMAQGIVIDKNNLSKKMLAPDAEQIEQLIHKSGLRSQTATTLTDLGNNMYLLDGTTDPSSSLLEMKVSATQWAKLTSGNDYYGELQNLSKLIYTKFNDDFDYIFFVLDIPQDNTIINQVGFYGVNCSVSNDVQGIGISTYNNGSYWGANSKLKSVMYLPYYSAILNGPALHELCHNWAVFICPTYAPDNTDYYAHWGVANAGGQLGGFRYVRTVEQNSGGVQGKTLYQASFDSNETNADGSFKYPGFGVNANGGNGLPYSDIELYLMGMKSAQELRNANFHLDIYSGNDYEASGDRSFGNGYFYSTTKTAYTIDDLITLRGARIPDAASSQKQFKLLTVSITLESAATTYYEQIISNVGWMAGPYNDQTYSGWLYNFRQATNNVGSLVMDNIRASLKSTSQLSSDATLASLTVSDGTLSPVFAPNTTNYSVNVANNVSGITISATANHSAAAVNGAGTKTLNVGTNNFSIVVTAEDGTEKTYTVVVTRATGTVTGPCENPVASGMTGSLNWTLCSDGTLTISGTGAMPDYQGLTAPWYEDRENIQKIIIEDGVTSIGRDAFFQSENLTSVTIPNSVTSIGMEAFMNCFNLLSVTIPNSITSIENDAFAYCYGLTSITIPNSVTNIGYGAFEGCSHLTAINVDDTNNDYSSEDGVLYNKAKTILHTCPAGKNAAAFVIPNSVTSIAPYAFVNCTNLTSVTISNSVTSIGDYAFARCRGLISITIPGSVTNIGIAPFESCSSLSSFAVEETNTYYSSENGTLYNKDKTILHSYIGGNSSTMFEIPNTVTGIKLMAFSNFNGTSILIPNSVTSIETYAFANCQSLTDVTVMWNTPLAVSNIFSLSLTPVTLHVPYGTKSLYEATDVWKDFGTIIEQAPDTIAVTGITLSKKTLELKVDSTAQLTATISPEDATNQIYTWVTSNAAIATVSDSGLVTAVVAGTAYIYAIITDGKNIFNDSCLVTVTNSTVSVTGIDLNKTSVSLLIGENEQLTATVSPDSATNKNVTWSSSNETIATVSATGLVTAKAEGSTTITDTTEDGGFTASCVVTVTRPLSNDATLSNLTISAGTLTPEFNPNTTNYSVSVENSVSSITITATANHAAATISGAGTKTLNTGANSFDITVTAEDGTTKTYTVTVNRAQVISIPVTGVSLNQTTLTLKTDSTAQLTATVTPGNADNKAVTWSSSDNSIATVSNGLITGISEGTATITVTTEDGGYTASCLVTVKKNQTVIVEENEPAGANGTGKFDLSLTIPANTLFTGSFILTLPNGFHLDVQATKLSGDLSSSLTLSLTQNADGSWLFTISGITLRSSTESIYQKIVDIVYTIDESLENGQYEVAISDLSLVFEDGTHIDEPEIVANVTVDHSYTGIQSPNLAAPIVQIRNNYLYVNTVVEEYIQIYSVTGQLLYSRNKQAGEIIVALPFAKGQTLVIKGSSGWVKKVM